ncbi:helix-turn-helix domain-containing protein [Paraburkholderia phymatum]|uniref:Winged helix-turn-helix domain-containing protein n=1 Tax=Paraburkholderia phymatum (strain DSM 17167 / CIP 108236 / LMG 21445 / STM815) TaxID=391038 RepID=B2JTN7_PARP8|nr:helix-turn-helix domain-containing protein [Paraburkholderia phymatum]ACC75940.1 hypothetical protein Bphy_6930 [Paraburkholderia phymatum STM815]
MSENVQQNEPPLLHQMEKNGDKHQVAVGGVVLNSGVVIDNRASPSVRTKILEEILAGNGGNDSRTQCARLLTALFRLGSVTTFEASRYLDIYHPPARKRDLVQQGYLIKTRSRAERTECGSIHRIGEYCFVNP